MKHVLFVATALLGFTVPYAANATLILDESVNGGAFTTLCSGGPACSPGVTFTDPAGIVFLILGASSNAPGTLANGDVTQAAVRVTNSSGATQSIVLRAGDTGFTAPSGSTVLSNNISGTVVTGSPVNLFSSTACANPSDAQNSCAGAFQTAVINSNITQSNSSGANSNNLAIANLLTPFSLTEAIYFTLGAGSVITFSASADVVPAGEPMGLALLGVGLLGLGVVRARARR
jgi:hypothetical protein